MKKIVLILLACMLTNSYSQNKNSGIDICIALKGFNSSLEAENTLDRILSTMGGSKNFVMQECSNVANASALQVEGIRYIFYNQQWMRSLNNSNSNAGLFTLAHEVGHHINGHTLDWLLIASKSVNPKTLAERRKQELEADEFAAFVIAKLGVSINDANDIMNTVSNDSDDTFSSHPARAKRLLAIKKGYDKAKKNYDSNYIYDNEENNYEVLIFSDGSRWEGASEGFYKPVPNDGKVYIKQKYKRPYGKGILYEIDGSVYKGTHYGGYKSGYGEEYYIDGSIYRGQWLNGKQSGRGQLVKPSGAVITVINGLSEKKIEAEKFFNLGQEKTTAEEAIADFSKAIELDPDYAQAYWNRAYEKIELDDYKGALIDLNKSISLESYYFNHYLRGICKHTLEDYKGAIADYSKALELYEVDPNDTDEIEFKAKIIGSRGHSKETNEDFNAAIEDFNKAIELDNTKDLYYNSRGGCKYNLSQYDGAAEDFSKAIEINNSIDSYYYFRGVCNFYLMNYNEAIEDYTKVLELNQESNNTYLLRARAKSEINDKTACSDLRKAKDLGVEFTEDDNILMLKVCK